MTDPAPTEIAAAPEPPADKPKRIDLIDALRGFALLGILLVNIPYFSTAYLRDLGIDDPNWTSWLDTAAQWGTVLLFEYKFYLLFSFLFGYSFVLQMQAAERQGVGFTARMSRRLFGLFVLGALHAVFLWHGDILTLYACLGVLLLMLRNVDAKMAVGIGVTFLVFYVVIWLLISASVAIAGVELVDLAESRTEIEDAIESYQSGFGDVVAQRLYELPYYVGSIWFVQAPVAFAMFMFGLAAAKTRVLVDLQHHRKHFVKTLAIGLPIGLAGAALYVYCSFHDYDSWLVYFALVVAALTAPFLTASYVSIFALGSARRAGQNVIQALAPVGKMALSNYILQSVIMGFVFFGYGLGLYSETSPFETLLIALAIFAIQIPLSRWWMNRHIYGPLEWLLRAFTNWERPAWRKQIRA